MKFKVDGRDMKIFVNGEEQSKVIKKAKLSDKGKKLNETVKEAMAKKAKEDGM